MTQEEELSKAKARIKKYLERTIEKGSTESEANFAMSKVDELLSMYNLSLSDLDLSDEEYLHHIVETDGRTNTAAGKVLVSIGKMCDCMVWFTKDPNMNYHIFGMETDVMLAVYLYDLIEIAIGNELIKFKNSDMYLNYAGHGKKMHADFLHGITGRISNRLLAMAENNAESARRDREERARTTGITNLPTIIERKAEAVTEKHAEEFNFKLKIGAGKKNYSKRRIGDGYYEGYRAGDKINLNAPINDKKQGGTLLLK